MRQLFDALAGLSTCRRLCLAATRLCGAALFLAAQAWATPPQDVVILLRPAPEARPALQAAFNRLQGELRLHGFSMRVVDGPEAPSASDLEHFADQGHAVAAVAFLEQGSSARVDVWISDRVTGKTSKRTIQPSRGEDAATVLAVRALELLRASLREYAELDETEALPGVHPERASGAVRTLGQSPATSEWVVALGGFAGWSRPEGGVSAGPELSAGFETGDAALRWGVRAVVLGPAWGGSHRAEQGSFGHRWLSGLIEPQWHTPLGPVRFSLFPSLGATRWDVSGEAFAPFRGRVDAAWTLAVGGGTELSVALDESGAGGGGRARLYLALRAVTSVPAPRVHIAGEEARLGTPLLIGGAGLRVTF